ncbi:cytochrome c [Myroides marinus]|uniref:Cytochrome c n=1 Tax=Myroides marinus TaxID=703342 RepID=A0A1H6R9K7_9FLAO|nr:c-type cytochrome [Myroides marinus]KUF45349.1 cytochrome C552 [Myroides marinus]MDM1352825.1 cytochrome c [Myroides marinus]MDM1359947.1 cytochrome c [Myroides marinus]MDM1402601.1 cytochrome c [Myroides marinus]MDM1501838.1 cytochrome c [Myroides marinus]
MSKLIKSGLLFLIAISSIACGGKDAKSESTPSGEEMTVTSEADKIAQGEKIFTGKGNCTTCHMADKKLIGPSIQDIVKGYDAKGGDLTAFLRAKADPIIEPAQFPMMEANLNITKKLTPLEMEALILYMRSL